MTVLNFTAVRRVGDRDFYTFTSEDGAIVREFDQPAENATMAASVEEFEDAHGPIWRFRS